MADLVQYLGLQAPVSEITHKLELVYGTMASLIFNAEFYKLQQGNPEKVPVYVTHLEGVLNAVQQEYSMMLSMGKVQRHLRDCLTVAWYHALFVWWPEGNVPSTNDSSL